MKDAAGSTPVVSSSLKAHEKREGGDGGSHNGSNNGSSRGDSPAARSPRPGGGGGGNQHRDDDTESVHSMDSAPSDGGLSHATSAMTGATLLYVELVANTFASHDANGRVVGVCFVGQDVTIEREAERGYARMQGDYAAIVNTKHHSLMPPIFACNGESPRAGVVIAFSIENKRD